MPIQNFAGTAISNTYQRVVQTDGTYLADGTGSLINNLTLPGNLVVSGTLYAQNTIIVTQSFSSGSNILGDAANDFQTLYGTVRIPTGSLTVTGSLRVLLTSSADLLKIDSPATSSIIYVSGSGVIGFNQTSSLTSQATFRGILGNSYLTEINTTTNGGYGLRTDGPAKAAGYFFSNAGGGSIQTAGGVSMMTFDSLLNVGIAVSSSIGARLHVRGSGTTSATAAFRVENANTSASLVVLDDRQTRITSEGAALYVEGAGVSPFSQNIAEFRYAGNGNSLIIAQQNGIAGLTTSTNADLNINPNGSGTTVFLQGKQVRFFNSSNNSNIALQNNGGSGQARLDFVTGSTRIMSITSSGNIGIGTTTPTYTLDVIGSGRFTSGVIVTGSLSVSGSQNYTGDVNINGTLTATVKSFLINHPTQPGKRLQYGNLEGPEHGVYFRGKSTSNIIELPEEWIGLVDEETITVQLTSIGKHQPLYVEEIKDNKVIVGVSGWILSQPSLNYYYLIHGERKDVNKLITTIN